MDYRIERLQDMGRALRASKELADAERLPRERVERLQHERLNALVRYATESSPCGGSACRAARWSCPCCPS